MGKSDICGLQALVGAICVQPLGRECAAAAASGAGSWPQESQRLMDCNVPVWASTWLCWLFVLGEEGKTRRLLHVFVTDIHSGEKIWESNSELALVRECFKNSHSFSSHIAFLLNGSFWFSLWICIKSTAKENEFWRWLCIRIEVYFIQRWWDRFFLPSLCR